MSAMHTPDAPARSTDTRHLYRIINTVSSTLDLDRVLRAIVDLVSDAVDCHACFVYVVEPDASLVLRAVSDPYTALVGRLRFEPGEGLAGWVAQHDEPVFLAEGALDRPASQGRARGRGGSLPVARRRAAARQGGRGHRRHLASLRGAARVHAGRLGLHDARGEPGRGRDRERPPLRADAAPAGARRGPRRPVAGRVRRPRRSSSSFRPSPAGRSGCSHAEACEVFVASGADGRFRRGAAWPDAPGSDTPLTAAEIGVELARAAADGGDGRRMAELLWGTGAGARALVVPLVAADELVGVLALRMSAQRPIDPEERELAASIAGQTAVGITNVRMIERLTAHNAIKDFLEDLSAGRTPAADLRDRAARSASTSTSRTSCCSPCRAPGPASRSLGRRRPRARGRRGPRVPRFALRPPRRRRARARAPRVARRGPRRGPPARDPRRAQQGPPARDRALPALRGSRRARAPASRRPSTPSPRRRW